MRAVFQSLRQRAAHQESIGVMEQLIHGTTFCCMTMLESSSKQAAALRFVSLGELCLLNDGIVLNRVLLAGNSRELELSSAIVSLFPEVKSQAALCSAISRWGNTVSKRDTNSLLMCIIDFRTT